VETGIVKRTIPWAGGDKEFAFRLSHNSMCEAQGKLGYEYSPEGDQAFFRDLGNGDAYRGFKRLRTFIHHALLEKHPDITEEQAGEVITALRFSGTSKLIKDLLRWMMPEPDPEAKVAEGKAPADPSPGTSS
jgi:hypothetical protein